MTPRLNVSLDEEDKVRLAKLKEIYENKFQIGLSLSAVIRLAIANALVREQN